jgi:hypothetical protein
VYSPAPIINALIIFASCVVNAVRWHSRALHVCSGATHPGPDVVVSWQQHGSKPANDLNAS